MRSHLLFLHIHFHVFDQDTGSIEGPKIGLCGMAIVQGQVLSGWKGGSGLFRTSVGSGAYGRHSTCCIVDCCHRSRRSRSVVNYAQEGDEEAYAGQGDWLAGNGPGKSRRPPDEIDRLIGRVALYVRNPGAAVADVLTFVTNALRMTRYLHRPALYTSCVRSVLVVAVMILFCAIVFGLDSWLSLLLKTSQSQG